MKKALAPHPVQRGRGTIIGGAVVVAAVIAVVWISLANRRASSADRPAVSVRIANIAQGDVLPPDIDVVIRSSGVRASAAEPARLRYSFQMDGGKFDTRAYSESAQRPADSPIGPGTGVRYSATAEPRIRYQNLPVGRHTLTVRVVDRRGQVVPRVRDSVTFTVRAPKLTIPAARATNARGEGITAPEPGARVGRDFEARVTVPSTFEIQPPAPGSTSLLPRRYITWMLDNGAFDVPAHSSATGLSGSQRRSTTTTPSVSYRDIPDGRHVLTVKFVDTRAPRLAQTYTTEFTVAS